MRPMLVIVEVTWDRQITWNVIVAALRSRSQPKMRLFLGPWFIFQPSILERGCNVMNLRRMSLSESSVPIHSKTLLRRRSLRAPLDECIEDQDYTDSAHVRNLVPGLVSFCDQKPDVVENPTLYDFIATRLPKMYLPFCDDFGPVSLKVVVQFCQKMNQRIWNTAKRHQIVCCGTDPKERANAYFLLASFLVLEHHRTPEDACRPFQEATRTTPAFRDASALPADFFLSLQDCTSGLWKAKEKGWLNTNGSLRDWGEQGDISLVCPKFIAFKGPVADRRQQSPGDFSPEHYAAVLGKLGVSAVIQLNEEKTYDPKAFSNHGIRHYHLPFRSSRQGAPSMATVQEFVEVCVKEGTVAVHCQGGRGRTGTLLAVWMIRFHGFSAREAIAWLRIVRPGSVVGPQQRFLARMDLALASSSATRNMRAESTTASSTCDGGRPAVTSFQRVGSSAVRSRHTAPLTILPSPTHMQLTAPKSASSSHHAAQTAPPAALQVSTTEAVEVSGQPHRRHRPPRLRVTPQTRADSRDSVTADSDSPRSRAQTVSARDDVATTGATSKGATDAKAQSVVTASEASAQTGRRSSMPNAASNGLLEGLLAIQAAARFDGVIEI